MQNEHSTWYQAHVRAVNSVRSLMKPFAYAEDFYQEVVVESCVFAEACKLFPGYNGRQSIEAAEWMMNQIDDGSKDQPGCADWVRLKDEVLEMIVAGLT